MLEHAFWLLLGCLVSVLVYIWSQHVDSDKEIKDRLKSLEDIVADLQNSVRSLFERFTRKG